MSERWQMTKPNPGHLALIDMMIAQPTATAEQLAQKLGRTTTWVSLCRSSDMFREMYVERAKELADPILSADITERFDMMVARSVEVLNEKLARPAQDIPDNLALQAAALGAKVKGLGGFSSKAPGPPEAPLAGRIERLADRILHLNNPQGITDAQIIERVPEALALRPT